MFSYEKKNCHSFQPLTIPAQFTKYLQETLPMLVCTALTNEPCISTFSTLTPFKIETEP